MALDASGLLELLAEHELAIKHLYLTFAGAFDDVRGFWQTLAGDEQAHADRLEALLMEAGLDQWLGHQDRLKPEAIRSSVDHMREQSERAARGELTLLQALAVARDIEDALIDRMVLLPGTEGHPGIDAVISELKIETSEHRELIAEALATEKRLRL